MTQFFSSGCQISENREEAANDKVFVPTAQSRIQARDLLIITDLIRVQTRDKLRKWYMADIYFSISISINKKVILTQKYVQKNIWIRKKIFFTNPELLAYQP